MFIKNYACLLGAEKLTISKAGAVKVQFVKETRLNPEYIGNCAGNRKIIYRFNSEYEISLSIDSSNILQSVLDFFGELYTLTSNK